MGLTNALSSYNSFGRNLFAKDSAPGDNRQSTSKDLLWMWTVSPGSDDFP